MMNQSGFTSKFILRDMVEEESRLLVVLSRFDISLGFGDSTVEEVCRKNGVDTFTFLAVVNFITGKEWDDYPISLPTLMRYLRNSHRRFIDYSLPNIKKTLIEGFHEARSSETSMVILQFFDTYMDEVRSHMDYEDTVIFSYVENLLAGNITQRFQITDFSSRHDHMAGKLDDLKQLFIYKYNQENNDMISSALMQLMTCGRDLIEHCEIENRMLFPQVERLERELHSRQSDKGKEKEMESASSGLLTEREKEVLRGIAQGLSTKEIADKLCLSFHTVNTYRKNLGEKLNIHSATGMAVYAILHHIIEISEINIP